MIIQFLLTFKFKKKKISLLMIAIITDNTTQINDKINDFLNRQLQWPLTFLRVGQLALKVFVDLVLS